ncbi:hypothetical protein ACGF0D_12615 [Kitasatospora sp. NPDC048298]|uniref:hypothetical protein n=1 Tax=Kitasatospora sp. NPDC048298 TaxID=3364049 RepID=UPI00371A005E
MAAFASGRPGAKEYEDRYGHGWEADLMDGTGQAAVALAVVLRDAHFGLRRLARAWEEGAPVGSVRRRESLGPGWQFSDRPDEASYADGQVIELASGLTVAVQLSIGFSVTGTDLLATVAVEDDEGNVAELLSTGPEEFPLSAEDLIVEIGQCLNRMERLDLSGVIR